MKTLKMICTAAVLTLVLTISGLAGEITTPGLVADDPKPVVTQPEPNPEDVPLPEENGAAGLMAILRSLGAIFSPTERSHK